MQVPRSSSQSLLLYLKRSDLPEQIRFRQFKWKMKTHKSCPENPQSRVFENLSFYYTLLMNGCQFPRREKHTRPFTRRIRLAREIDAGNARVRAARILCALAHIGFLSVCRLAGRQSPNPSDTLPSLYGEWWGQTEWEGFARTD